MFEPLNLCAASAQIVQTTALLSKLEYAMLARGSLTEDYVFAFFILSDDTMVVFAEQIETDIVFHGHVKLGTEMEMISEISEILDSTNYIGSTEIADLNDCFNKSGYSIVDAYEAMVSRALRDSACRIILRRAF